MNVTYRSVTIGIHQFAQRRVFFDFELDDSIILTQDLQVNVLGFSLKKEKQICCYTYIYVKTHSHIYVFSSFPALFHKQTGILKMAPIFPVITSGLRGNRIFFFLNFVQNMFCSFARLNYNLLVCVYVQMHMCMGVPCIRSFNRLYFAQAKQIFIFNHICPRDVPNNYLPFFPHSFSGVI